MGIFDDVFNLLGVDPSEEEPEPEKMNFIERGLRLARGEDIPPLREEPITAHPTGPAQEFSVGALKRFRERLQEKTGAIAGLDPAVRAMSPIRGTEIQLPEATTTAGKVGELAGTVAPDVIGGVLSPTVVAAPVVQAVQGAGEELASGGSLLDAGFSAIGGFFGGVFGKGVAKALGRELVQTTLRESSTTIIESPAIKFAQNLVDAKFGPVEAAQEAITASMKSQDKNAASVFRVLASEAGASPHDVTAGLVRANQAGGSPESFAEELLDITRRGFSHTADPFTEASGISIKLEPEIVEPVLSPRLQRLKDIREAGVPLGRQAAPTVPEPRQRLLGAAEQPAFGEIIRETPELSPRLARLAERRNRGLTPAPVGEEFKGLPVEKSFRVNDSGVETMFIQVGKGKNIDDVGMIDVEFRPDEAFVPLVTIGKNIRQKGVATKIFNDVVEEAARRGIRKIGGIPSGETPEVIKRGIRLANKRLAQTLGPDFGILSADPKIGEIARKISGEKPFRTLQGSTQERMDTIVQKGLRNYLDPKTVKNFMEVLSPEQRHALGVSYTANSLSSARSVINKLQEVTTSANLKEHLTRSLAEESLNKGATHSGITGEDGFLMVGRLVDAMPRGSVPDLKQVRSAVKKAAGSSKWETVFYTAMLSNPKTLARNAIGNAVELAMQTAGRAGRGLVTGNISQAGAQAQALVNFRQFGLGEGIKQAWQRAGKAWTRGVPEFLNSEELAARGSVEGWKGALKAFPRAMAATDDFFTTLSFHMDLYDQVYRRAWKSGKRGAALKGDVLRMIKSPPQDIADEAMKTARRTVFRDTNPDIVENTLLAGAEKVRGFPVLGRALFPFIRTPFNLAKRGLEYTPLNFLGALGQALAGNTYATRQAIQRASVGTSLMGYMAYEAYNGNISGDGQHLSQKERATKMASGWKPLAIKFGDRWLSYRNMGPITAMLTISSNAAERAREGEDWADWLGNQDGNVINDTIKGVIDSSFLPNVVEMLAGLDNPDRYGKGAMENLMRITAANVGLPSLAFSIASAVDPTIRERATIGEAFSPISGDPSLLLTGTRPRLGLFGEELKRGTVGDPVGRFAEIFLNPATATRLSEDPLILELVRLQQAGFPEANFNPPGLKSSDLGLKDDALSPDQIVVGRKSKGFLQRQFLERMLQNPRWDQIPDEGKTRILRKQFEAAGRVANARMKTLVRNKRELNFRDIVKGFE